MDYIYLISQLFALVAFIISLLAFHKSEKIKIFETANVSVIFNLIHYFLLNAYNGFFTKLLALFRNSFIIYKDKKKINSNLFFVIFIILYLLVSIFTYKNIYSILPSIAGIIYLVVIWNGNELAIKKVGCFCYFLWLVYNIFVFSIMGIVSSVVAIISTFVAVLNYQKNMNINDVCVKTIDNDEKFLRRKSKLVSFNNKNYLEDIKYLKEFCKKQDCMAVSGVQLGILKRIVLINKSKDRDYRIIINPTVLSCKGKTEYWEACVSVPNKIGLVTRPYEIELEYYDENGVKKREIFNDFIVTIIMHEIDHLDGVLYIDKANGIKDVTKEEREIFRKENPYRVISKD